MARLTVICGLPGSGKTTTARRMAAATGGIRMCPDEWMQQLHIDLWDEPARSRIEQLQWTVSQELLLAGSDVIIEWGTWAKVERDTLRTWCREHDVVVSLVHLDVHPDELWRRIRTRNQQDGEVVISRDHLHEWFSGPFQPPTDAELALFDPLDPFTRPWQPDDVPFLWEMLYQSIHVREGQQPPPRSVLDAPDIGHYLVDFGARDGDDAQVALDEHGTRIAAAFCRRMPADDPGYGFVADDIPEFGMAVMPEHRGRGVGRAVLVALLERHPVISLSVDTDNHGARALYESLGFVDVELVGTSTTMVRR